MPAIPLANNSMQGYINDYGGGVIKAHTGTRMGIGQNAGWMQYWADEYPYINIVKGAQLASNPTALPGTVNAQGFIDCSASGSYRFTCTSVNDYIETGIWTLRWEGPGTPDVSWQVGTETIVDDVGPFFEKTYEVLSNVGPNNGLLTVSGGSGFLTKLELIAPNQLARYDAGNILHSKMVADMAGCPIIRPIHYQWLNNYDAQVNEADFTPYDFVTWNAGMYDGYLSGNPIRAICEVANECSASAMFSFPHQISNAGAQYIIDQVDQFAVNTWYGELSNEVWNSAFEQTKWFDDFDAVLHEVAIDPVTAIVSETAHGHPSGEIIRCFNTMIHDDWPFASSGSLRVIADAVNTFRVTGSANSTINKNVDIVSIIPGNPTVIEVTAYQYTNATEVFIDGGDMVELSGQPDFVITVLTADTFSIPIDSTGFTPYTAGGLALQDAIKQGSPPEAKVIDLRYKLPSESSLNLSENYGDRYVELMNMAKTTLGSKVIRVLGAKANGSNFLRDRIARPGVREVTDVIALGMYIGVKSFPTSNWPIGQGDETGYPIAAWPNVTIAEMTDNMIDNVPPNRTIPNFYENMAQAKCYRIMNYECGEHNGYFESNDQYGDDSRAKLTEWARSAEAGRFYTWYWPFLASLGYDVSCHFSHVSEDGSGTFGMQIYSGEVGSFKWDATKPYWDKGGAHKP